MTTSNGTVAGRLLLVLALAVPLGLAAAPDAGGGETVTPPPQTTTHELPKGKQTVLGLYVTAREAYEKWKADPEKVKILDVRTLEEFIFVGHAPMAWHVPVVFQSYEWDAKAGRFPMTPNPEFLSQVKAVASPADTLLVTCRSGTRSAMAVNALAKAGYTKVYNIIDGMEGDQVTDPDSVFVGMHLKNGWKLSGLPWTYDVDPDRVSRPK